MTYAHLLAELADEFPGFRLLRKSDVWHQRLIGWLLRPINPAYMTSYVTTIGRSIYVPEDWAEDARAVRVLRHERVHLRQFRRYTWVGMAVLYLLLPLPLGLAYFRARLEREAYRETLVAYAQDGASVARLIEVGAHIHKQLTGPAYGWALGLLPGVVRRWIDDDVAWAVLQRPSPVTNPVHP